MKRLTQAESAGYLHATIYTIGARVFEFPSHSYTCCEGSGATVTVRTGLSLFLADDVCKPRIYMLWAIFLHPFSISENGLA